MPVELQERVGAAVSALELTPAGPALAGMLAGLDPAVLSGAECVLLMRARYRQSNHERGQLLAVVDEVRRRGVADAAGFGARPDQAGEFAADEVRAALVLTRRAAEDLCHLAEDLTHRLATVGAALRAGRLDQPRARVFSEWTAGLSDQHASAVCAALLPLAGSLTTGQLIDKLKRHAIALDPTWARRRYEKALRGRRVVGHRNADGTASLHGYDLPPERVVAACARLDALGLAAQRAGHPGRLDHIRAEIYLGMLDGRFHDLDDRTIITHLLTTADATDPAHPASNGSGGGTDPNEPDPGDADGGDDGDTGPGHPPAGGPPPPGPGPNGAARGHGPTDSSATDSSATDSAEAGAGAPEDNVTRATDTGDGGGGSGRRGWADGRGVELSVRLGTLLGHDRQPAELLGWAPVHAEQARAIAAAHGGGSWRYVITDPDGHPIVVAPLRRRPTTSIRGPSRAVVELLIDRTGLLALAGRSDLPDRWPAVIAEMTAGLARPGAPAGDPTARGPRAALRRWIRARDRTCVHPFCRIPARRTDADHSIEYARGGATTDTNLGSACRHDHRLRHDGGWILTQIATGHFLWTSPQGMHYLRQPPKTLDDLPDPITTDDTDSDDQDDYRCPSWDQPASMEPEPPPQPPPPPPPPPRRTQPTTSPRSDHHPKPAHTPPPAGAAGPRPH